MYRKYVSASKIMILKAMGLETMLKIGRELFWQKFSDNFGTERVQKMSKLLQFSIKVSNISQIFRISHVSQYSEAAVWINSTWGIQSNSN